MKKEFFETPVIDVVLFNENDVIATSGGFVIDPDGDMEGEFDDFG